MIEVILDSLLDSLKICALVLIINFLLSFIESKVAMLIEKKGRLAPIMGSIFGAVPQCGVSVVAADLYQKKHITMGTLIAVFISCSDEALPIVFSNLNGKWYMGFVLLGIKITAAILVGYLVDLILKRRMIEVEEHHHHCEGETDIHIGCCKHNIDKKEDAIHSHLIHPLIHTLKIFIYVLIVNLFFGTVIYFVGEDVISSFLDSNKLLTPLISWLIGLIPNCASSVLISEAYILGNIPFSALLCGLTVNAGLGMIVLLKNKKDWKNVLLIFVILSAVSLALGYGFLFI